MKTSARRHINSNCVCVTLFFWLATAPLLVQADKLEEGRAAIGAGNYAKAHELLAPLAEVGDAVAQNAMGVLYVQGWGVVADPERAVDFFQRSAEQGNIKGSMNLADAYRTGNGVKQNCAMARDLLAPIARDGLAKAQVVLGSIYDNGCSGFPSDPKKAFQWYAAAAAQEDPYGLGNVGAMYALGLGVEQDYSEAKKHYSEAAELGNSKAAYNLGRMYELGEGMPPDPDQAKQWYRKAVSMGEAEAEQRLNALENQGTLGSTINEVLLAEALKAPSIELAKSYGSITNVIEMLPLAEAGVTLQLPDGDVNKANVAAVRIELEQRMAVYAQAIDQRGVADLKGKYTAIAGDCGNSGSAWTMAITEGYDRIFVEQNGSEVKFAASKKRRRSSNDIVAEGFCVETAIALIDPMNSDYVLVGESHNGQITISPDAESVLNAWPDFIQPPSRSSLSSCVVTLTPAQ
jgi:TPR repeat protein